MTTRRRQPAPALDRSRPTTGPDRRPTPPARARGLALGLALGAAATVVLNRLTLAVLDVTASEGTLVIGLLVALPAALVLVGVLALSTPRSRWVGVGLVLAPPLTVAAEIVHVLSTLDLS